MEKKEPLLSICIPTYNRADVLAQCLESIVTNEGFGDNVEVVVSNNCSTDDTEKVSLEYASKYPNIKYFKNDTNIGGDRNILRALELGTGTFLKLQNDYRIFRKGSITFLLGIIKQHIEEKPVLFFHHEMGKGKNYETTSFDELLFNEKMGLGSISSHGYWKDEFKAFENKDARIDTMFQQLDWTIRSYKQKKHIFCYNKKIYAMKRFKSPKGGYNFVKVCSINFFEQLNELLDEGIVSERSLEATKKGAAYLVTRQHMRSLYGAKKNYSFVTEDCWKIIKQQFGNYKWYRRTILKAIVISILETPYERLRAFMLNRNRL